MAVIKEETEGSCKMYIHDDFILEETEKQKELLLKIGYFYAKYCSMTKNKCSDKINSVRE